MNTSATASALIHLSAGEFVVNIRRPRDRRDLPVRTPRSSAWAAGPRPRAADFRDQPNARDSLISQGRAPRVPARDAPATAAFAVQMTRGGRALRRRSASSVAPGFVCLDDRIRHSALATCRRPTGPRRSRAEGRRGSPPACEGCRPAVRGSWPSLSGSGRPSGLSTASRSLPQSMESRSPRTLGTLPALRRLQTGAPAALSLPSPAWCVRCLPRREVFPTAIPRPPGK